MLTRRSLLGGAAATLLAAPALAQGTVWRMPRSFLPRDVEVSAASPVGHIYVDTQNTWLYYVTGPGIARRYKVAVGAAGRQFNGWAYIARKAEWPAWVPTEEMVALEPDVYGPYRRGLPGGHDMNPLGARALYLYRGGVDTYFRIHGTPQPWTMGQSFSSGCVRLINEHIEELYDIVPVGTQVSAT